MGKYLIKSSESQCKRKLFDYKKSSISILFDKEINNNNNNNNNNSDSIKFEKDLQSLRIIGEGGRWNNNKDCIDTEARIKTAKIYRCLNNRLFIVSYFIPILIAMTLMSCEIKITIASPTPSLNNNNNIKYIIENNAVNDHNSYDKINVESFDKDYDFSNEYINPASRDRQKTGNFDSDELDKLRKTIMEDIGLTRIPDPRKANVSQTEYENAHREYLKRVELSKGQDQRTRRRLHVFYPADPVFDYNSSSINFADKKTPHSIYFPVDISPENHAVDHATLRILISHENENDEETDYNRDNEDLEDFVEVSIYQRTRSSSRRMIANQRVSIGPSSSRWAEFDSTEAVASWLYDGEENLGFEMEIKRHGAPVRWNEPAPAALNVFTISEVRTNGGRSRRATPDQLMSLHRGRRTECKGQNKKCCRHQMMVIFKDLKGFEFIIQPKDFDAGYCKGRCPPRYNPAHHHALLQSLIWKEDRKKAPRPCCAPSKLTELEILYFDENDSSKLKVSNWKNMKVLECACS